MAQEPLDTAGEKNQVGTVPVYLMVRQVVTERIERGEYPVGSCLPSENELAAEFATTRLTVRNAIDGLVEKGAVQRVQGKGAFVMGNAWREELSNTIGGFREAVRYANAEPGVRILGRGFRPAGPYYGNLFGVGEDELLHVVRRLNSVNGRPESIETALSPAALFPGLEDIDISIFSLFGSYELLGHRPSHCQEKLDIRLLSAREAGLLKVEPGSAGLLFECVTYDQDGLPIEFARSINRGDNGGFVYRF